MKAFLSGILVLIIGIFIISLIGELFIKWYIKNMLGDNL